MTDFASLIRLLAQNDIQYIVVGGAAATAHGAARLTQDLDIVYRRAPDNIAKLAECLSSHSPYLRGAPPGLPFSLDANTIQSRLNFTLVTDLGDLDLLGEITGLLTQAKGAIKVYVNVTKEADDKAQKVD